MSTWEQPSSPRPRIADSCLLMSWCFQSLPSMTALASWILEDTLDDPTAWVNLQAVPDALASQLVLLSLALVMLWGSNFWILNMGARLANFFLVHSLRHKMLSFHWFLASFHDIFPVFGSTIVIFLIKGNTLPHLFGLLWLSASALWLLSKSKGYEN